MKKAFFFLLCMFFCCQTGFAGDNLQKSGIPGENLASGLVEKFKLDTLTDAAKLLVLDTTLDEPHFYQLKRFNNEWVCLRDSKAQIGRGGAKQNKIEGDFATPKGLYNFIIAFGMNDNPGSVLPYYKLKPGDVWVTDPQSKYYNLLVRKNTVFIDWLSEIELFERPVRYAYVLVVDYNISHKEPYKGSALFLECSIGKPTDGSIALPRAFMEELMLFVDADTKIYIF